MKANCVLIIVATTILLANSSLDLTATCIMGHMDCNTSMAYEVTINDQSFIVCTDSCQVNKYQLSMNKCNQCSSGRCFFPKVMEYCIDQETFNASNVTEYSVECGDCSNYTECSGKCLNHEQNNWESCYPWSKCPFSSLAVNIGECSGDPATRGCQFCKRQEVMDLLTNVQLQQLYFSICQDCQPFFNEQVTNFLDNYQEQQYNWQNQEAWPGICQYGKHQSPVDIDPRGLDICVEGDFNYVEMKCFYPNILSGQGPTYAIAAQDAVIVFLNNQFDGYDIRAGTASTHVEFHAPSQHTIRGRQYDLELQIVTEPIDRGLWEKIVQDSEVFQFIKQSPEDLYASMNDGDFVSPNKAIVSFLFYASEEAESWLNEEGQIKTKHLLSCASEGLFYRYTGSETSPPCEAGVQWFVSRRPLKILPSELAQVQAVLAAENNRDLQDLEGRKLKIGGSICH